MAPGNLNGTRLEYEFSGVDADQIEVTVYTIPFFPVYKGRRNEFGISVDGQPAYIADNFPGEYSKPWKDQVLQNGDVVKVKFPIDKDLETHTLSLICGDPGVTIQRIIIDWGGLKKTYVGPSVLLRDN